MKKIIFLAYLTLNSILMLFIFSIEINNAILTYILNLSTDMRVLIFSLILTLSFTSNAQSSYMPKTLDMKERAVIVDRWLQRTHGHSTPRFDEKNGHRYVVDHRT